MHDAAYAALDGPLHALVRRDAPPGALAPLTVRDAHGGRSLPTFTTADRAEAHRAALPHDVRGDTRTYAVPAGDPRAKEELLRAAQALGATRLEVDPDPALRPAATLELDLALGHVVASKNASACL